MANKDKAKAENGGVPRKSKRSTDSTKIDIEAFSETWNSVGHLLTPIPDADIEWAKSHVKSQEKSS